MQRKVFVGGVPDSLTVEIMAKYFSAFGQVIRCEQAVNTKTGQSKGYAFVTFRDHMSAARVTDVVDHVIDGVKVDCKSCMSKDKVKNKRKDDKVMHRKLYVTGFERGTTQEEVRELFSQWGVLEEVNLMHPAKKTEMSFGFVTFKDENNCRELIRQGMIYYRGAQLCIDVAKPKAEFIQNEKKQDLIKDTSANEILIMDQTNYGQPKAVNNHLSIEILNSKKIMTSYQNYQRQLNAGFCNQVNMFNNAQSATYSNGRKGLKARDGLFKYYSKESNQSHYEPVDKIFCDNNKDTLERGYHSWQCLPPTGFTPKNGKTSTKQDPSGPGAIGVNNMHVPSNLHHTTNILHKRLSIDERLTEKALSNSVFGLQELKKHQKHMQSARDMLDYDAIQIVTARWSGQKMTSQHLLSTPEETTSELADD